MQSNDARNLFQSEASLAQGRARAEKAKRTASGIQYGRPIWLGGNDGTGKRAPGKAGVALSDLTQSEPSEHGQKAFVSLAGKDESAGAAFDGGKTRILYALLESVSDGTNAHLITAESGALVRRIDLESGLALQLFKGHTAPVTALAVLEVPSGSVRRKILFSSGWDRSIRAWPLYEAASLPDEGAPVRTASPLLVHSDAASDFIKALLAVPSPTQPVLLSGGSDRVIRIWSLSRLQASVLALDDQSWQDPLLASQAITQQLGGEGSGAKLDLLGTFSEHTRPITAFELLPPRPDGPSSGQTSSPIIFSADSLGRIAQSELEISPPQNSSGGPGSARLRPVRELKGNEASISALRAGWIRYELEDHDEDAQEGVEREAWEARLWSASRDRSAYAYTVVSSPKAPRKSTRRPPISQNTGASSSKASLQFGIQEPILPDIVVNHPDYVTAVLDFALIRREPRSSLGNVTDQSTGLEPHLITACSDEEIRSWSMSDADDVLDETRTGDAKVFDIHGNAADATSRTSGARLRGRIEAHWHEISALYAWWRVPPPSGDGGSTEAGQWWVVSASYDGSVRRWSLQELLKIAEASRLAEQDAAQSQKAAPAENKDIAKGTNEGGGGVELTAEEEAELAELMGSDDE
ncbi:hypothetical protein OC846_005341 [Tilletia horrida]|uniref:WD40 repeat-like protein n=1 Tax=Tilletia horrida TaxID=155126 RepID=A0AAN6JQB6_9BASI|nr:hypothetical protein OC845_004977 [Tilletia horrida]KAK0546278.1 hypothetical protein OC846_005341 [Tilletia horrida]KAK0562939.1 hypothetical protein OC861_005072 [Tilletia horrida]